MKSVVSDALLVDAGGNVGRTTNSPPANVKVSSSYRGCCRKQQVEKYTLDKLLTIQQLAARLSVKVRTIRSWIYNRTIPFTRLGRRVYIHTEVIERLLNGNAIPRCRWTVRQAQSPWGKEASKHRKELLKWRNCRSRL